MQRRKTSSKQTNIWNSSIAKTPNPQNCLTKLFPLIPQFGNAPVQSGRATWPVLPGHTSWAGRNDAVTKTCPLRGLNTSRYRSPHRIEWQFIRQQRGRASKREKRTFTDTTMLSNGTKDDEPGHTRAGCWSITYPKTKKEMNKIYYIKLSLNLTNKMMLSFQRPWTIFTKTSQCNYYPKWNCNHFLKVVLQKTLSEHVITKPEIIHRTYQK